MVMRRAGGRWSNCWLGTRIEKSLFSIETVRVNVLSKQLKFQKFQERCVQHDAFQRTTRNIKHRTTSYIGTLKTRDFWSKRAQIESKKHNNVVNIVLYWTILGLSAPYEVVEWSCAIFCISIVFSRYNINICVGIRYYSGVLVPCSCLYLPQFFQKNWFWTISKYLTC